MKISEKIYEITTAKELGQIIRECPFGSTVRCKTEEQVELGRIARDRMTPGKDIWFVTKPVEDI